MSEAGSGEFQLKEDMTFQRRQWRAERVGWLVASVILVLGVAGFAGRGPVASTQESDSAGVIRVSFDRIERREAPSSIKIEVANPSGVSELTLLISGHLFEGARITDIRPEPSSMIARDQALEIVVKVAEGEEAVQITLSVEHESLGRSGSSIGIVDGATVEFDQWVLP